ncbi:TIR domain-containing protein [Streptomyces sp. NBC_00075]|uniref:TIR domain-containing protein n=1 Tax=Streptomyces sp. NBC_00093 TaxID=2975649 RepID=A0AAU2A3H2_9ACTN
MSEAEAERPAPVRVFISYAHGNPIHADQVREFWRFLRACGIDGEFDLIADERRQDWARWMLRGIRDSRYVIVVASPEYRRRAEGDATAGEGMGVQWEARLLRSFVYEDPDAALERIIPVVLPGGSPDDLPAWLGGRTHTQYSVEEFTVAGAERLLRLLTGQLYETAPELGQVPVLPSRDQAAAQGMPAAQGAGAGRAPMVLAAPVVEPAPVPPEQPPPAAFGFPEKQALTQALLACEALHRLANRHDLLDRMGEILGRGHAFSVSESPDARTHLRALVNSISRTLARDTTLKALYLALAEIAPPDTDVGTERVRVLLVASGLVLGEG